MTTTNVEDIRNNEQSTEQNEKTGDEAVTETEYGNSTESSGGGAADENSKEISDENISDEKLMEDMLKEHGSADAIYMDSMRDLKEGEVVPGRVIEITKDFVIIDVGYKSEGQVPISEFADAQGNINVAHDDRIDVYIVEAEDETGAVILSKEIADKQKIWDDIGTAYDEGKEVEGVIIQRTKGGMIVDIGVRAFLPGSQIDLRPVKDMDGLINQKFKFQVIQFNRKRSNIVLSRRQLLEHERDRMRHDTIDRLQEGSVVTGTVKNITDYGIFIDLGGIDGLLHITDISWGKVNHPSDHFRVGDDIDVMVLNFDKENMRVSLGLKQITENPWTTATQKYQPGTKVTGKVVNITDYGTFVELEEGIEGLIHITEMSWSKKLRHPSKLVNIGDIVDAEVLDIDIENRRISLSIKQVQPNPWDILREKYPEGSIIEGKVKNITDFGVFIDINEGIDGLVHISDLTRRKRVKHPSEIYKKGQKVQAAVVKIDKEAGRFSLSIKQLEPDPWDELPRMYPTGSIVQGRVTKITDFGAFVEILEGVEGLVHISELSKDKVEHPKDILQVNQQQEFRVLNIDLMDKKIALSLKAVEEENDMKEAKSYLGSQGSSRVHLGDLFNQQIGDKLDEVKGVAKEEKEVEEKAEEVSSEPQAESSEAEDVKEESVTEEDDVQS